MVLGSYVKNFWNFAVFLDIIEYGVFVIKKRFSVERLVEEFIIGRTLEWRMTSCQPIAQ